MHLSATTKKGTPLDGKPSRHARRLRRPAARPPSVRARRLIAGFYRRLLGQWGPQNWWPADSQFEVIVGAILTQNTSWTNVERALRNLRQARMLSLKSIHEAESAHLETLLRPAGYFRQKTRRLQELTAFILASYGLAAEEEPSAVEPALARMFAKGEDHPALARMFAEPTEKLREVLLAQKGVGPETADSILLYGGNHAVFVVDAYTRRIFQRHKLAKPATAYETIRLMVEGALRDWPPEDDENAKPAHPEASLESPQTPRPEIHQPSAISAAYRSELAQRYNEFHALLVQVGKHYCLKKAPKCTNCPLSCFPPMSDNVQAGAGLR